MNLRMRGVHSLALRRRTGHQENNGQRVCDKKTPQRWRQIGYILWRQNTAEVRLVQLYG